MYIQFTSCVYGDPYTKFENRNIIFRFLVNDYVKFRITPVARSALQGNSDFMNKIEANDLILVLRHVLLKIKAIVA